MNLSTTSIVVIFLIVIGLALCFSLFFSPFENRDKGAFRDFGKKVDEKMEELNNDELLTPMKR